jgi:hypothetical protein
MDVSGEELRNPDIRDIPPLSRRSAPEIAELFKDAQQEAVDAATFFRSDFAFDPPRNLYVCPGGKELRKHHRAFAKPRGGLTKEGAMIVFARKHDREACAQAQVLPEHSCAQDRALRSRDVTVRFKGVHAPGALR